MAQFMKYPFFVKRVVMKYFRKCHKADEVKVLWNKTLERYKNFVEEAPDLGGKENNMSGNLYMALAVFSHCKFADGYE